MGKTNLLVEVLMPWVAQGKLHCYLPLSLSISAENSLPRWYVPPKLYEGNIMLLHA
jgi:hypothetical protein